MASIDHYNSQPHSIRIWQWTLILLIALGFLWLSGFGLFLQYVRGLQPQNPSEPTDAIIVLTGGAQRVNKGLDLLSTGMAGKLFITGVNGHVNLQEILSLWKRPIIHMGNDDCCIILDHRAQNTIQNARETREWVQKENIKKIRLVTSDYHMPRARLEFHKNMPGTIILTWPVKAYNAHINYYFIRLVFEEYNKTLLTVIKIYLLPEWAQSRMEPLLS